MTTLAEVVLWGRTIGAVSWDDERHYGAFEYDSAFAQSGIEISPVVMPLSEQIYTFPEPPKATFYGLPGLVADSLPDKFGNALIDVWLAKQGRTSSSFNPVERLCYTGSRGMGALEFKPVVGPQANETNTIIIDELVSVSYTHLTLPTKRIV